MITILESHYRFKLEVNKLNANFYQAFNPYEVDILLNKAQMLELSEKTNNKQGNGAEYDNVIQNQLSPILIHKEEIIPVNNRVKSSNFDNEVYKFISYQVQATKNNCTKTFDENKFQQHQTMLFETQKSDFRWGICNAYLSNVANEKGIIFEPKDFSINKAYVSYYKYPNKVCLGGYTDINGVALSTVEWSFTDEDMIQEIITKAALLALESIEPTVESKKFVESLHH